MEYKTNSVRCLGIDPGIANTGWAVVVKSKNGYRLTADGLIQTDSKASTGDRLLTLYKAISDVVATQLPETIAIERCFHNKNISSSMTTGAVIGVVQLVAAQIGLSVSEFTPQQVKASSGLGGRACKPLVQKMMCKVFRRDRLNPHVADAAATAIAGLLHTFSCGVRWNANRKT